MKILCVADHVDPLVYSTLIKDRFADIDLVLSAGDLPMYYNEYIVSTLNKPLLFVFGNHNLKCLPNFRKSARVYPAPIVPVEKKKYFGSTYIGGKVKRAKNLLIAGLGGSMRYNKGENQFTEFSMFMEIFKMIPKLIYNRIRHGRFLDIFLTHSPPRGIHDQPDRCHTGFKVFLWFLKRFKPKYMIHGHVHLYSLNEKRESMYHDTKIINAYNHIIIELEDIK